MIRLIQRRLIVPRGDTGTFSIPVLAGKDSGDTSIFTIFSPLTHRKIFEKVMENSDGVLKMDLTHGDTVNLPVGEYVWDIKFYTDPVFVDEKLVSGTEVDSYYSAFQLPICEIRETGDNLLMADDAPDSKLAPEQINYIDAAIIEIHNSMDAAVTSAAEASTSATSAETSASAAAASEAAAQDSQEAALASERAAQAAATDAANSAATATQKAAQIEADLATKADKSEIPTKVSDLTDDSGHYTKPITGIPASDLEETYLTEHQDLSNYVQKTDYATGNDAGVVKVGNGLAMSNNGTIGIQPAPSIYIKAGDQMYNPISPKRQHESTFYGLAKAAGDTTQSQSSNAIGTYTDEAKAAIQQMLDVPSTADIPTNVSELTNDAGYLTQHQDISRKANIADLATVATSGSYNDLLNKPTIPTAVSQLTDDSGHYTKPVSGIPATDMTSGVQTSLGLADTAYQKPNNGIPASDLASGVIPSVPVQDVQIKNTSILNNGIANIPLAANGAVGLVQGNNTYGTAITAAGDIMIYRADDSAIKNGNGEYKPIVPYTEHQAVFYGLARAAGDTTQRESQNNVGIYTSSAQSAIQAMLDVPSTSSVASSIASAVGNVHSFDIEVVQSLPTQNIKEHTIYFVPKTGDTNDVYDEYVYINNAWEMVGNTQIDLSNYVQKTDYASTAEAGVVKVNSGYGIYQDNGYLKLFYANIYGIKAGMDNNHPIAPINQHESTFYGLAKAAGDTTQSQSDNAVGIYTTEAKAAIRTMIGAKDEAYAPDLSNYVQKTDYATSSTNGIMVAQDKEFIDDIHINLVNQAKADNTKTYTISGGNYQFIDNDIVLIGDGTDRTVKINYYDDFDVSLNDIVYISAKLTTNAPSMYVGFIYDNNSFLAGSTINKTVMKSKNFTVNTSDQLNYISIYMRGSNASSVQNVSLTINNIVYINLTKVFGSGNEPDAKIIDDIINNNETFETLNLINEKYLYDTVLKINPVFLGGLSLGRQENSIVGRNSSALGSNIMASGVNSFAEGQETLALGDNSHSQGFLTLALGSYSYAQGIGYGSNSFKLTGSANTTTYVITQQNVDLNWINCMVVYKNKYAKILAVDTINNTITLSTSFIDALENETCYLCYGYALGTASHSEGFGTIANSLGMHSQGILNMPAILYPDWTSNTEYNIGDKVSKSGYGYECIEANSDSNWISSKWQLIYSNSDSIFIIGNGTAINGRSNALLIDINGNEKLNGNLYINCNNDSTGGSKVLCEADFATAQDIQAIINGGAGA